MKRETGCQNLDKLSENLAVSTKTNDLFKVDGTPCIILPDDCTDTAKQFFDFESK